MQPSATAATTRRPLPRPASADAAASARDRGAARAGWAGAAALSGADRSSTAATKPSSSSAATKSATAKWSRSRPAAGAAISSIGVALASSVTDAVRHVGHGDEIAGLDPADHPVVPVPALAQRAQPDPRSGPAARRPVSSDRHTAPARHRAAAAGRAPGAAGHRAASGASSAARFTVSIRPGTTGGIAGDQGDDQVRGQVAGDPRGNRAHRAKTASRPLRRVCRGAPSRRDCRGQRSLVHSQQRPAPGTKARDLDERAVVPGVHPRALRPGRPGWSRSVTRGAGRRRAGARRSRGPGSSDVLDAGRLEPLPGDLDVAVQPAEPGDRGSAFGCRCRLRCRGPAG